MELRQCHYRNVSQRRGKEEEARGRRERGRASEKEDTEKTGREREGGQHFHVHILPLAQRLLFGFFHSTGLQWQHCVQHEHSAHKPM